MASRHLRAVGEVRATPLTLVDSCVLLDIATDDPKWARLVGRGPRAGGDCILWSCALTAGARARFGGRQAPLGGMRSEPGVSVG